MIKKGQQIELMDGTKITVEKAKETSDGLVVISTYGEIYTESEINIPYKLAPEYILYLAMHRNHIDMEEYDKDLYKQVFDEFMDEMVKAGYICEKYEE